MIYSIWPGIKNREHKQANPQSAIFELLSAKILRSKKIQNSET